MRELMIPLRIFLHLSWYLDKWMDTWMDVGQAKPNSCSPSGQQLETHLTNGRPPYSHYHQQWINIDAIRTHKYLSVSARHCPHPPLINRGTWMGSHQPTQPTIYRYRWPATSSSTTPTTRASIEPLGRSFALAIHFWLELCVQITLLCVTRMWHLH